MKYEKWINENCSRLDGKTVCITGSTGGLGTVVANELAYLGANLILANRNKKKSEKQKEELLRLYPTIEIKILSVDMFDMYSVKLFVCKLKQIHFDILILNAGIYNVKRKTSNAGFDNVFQVNFVSPYYIAKQLLPTMRKNKNAKVIAVGSIAHNFTKLNPEDIQMKKSAKCSKIYGNSKRFLMFSLEKLFLDSHILLSIVHPGVTLTQMTNHYHKAINWLVKIGIKLFFPNKQKASLSILSGVFNQTEYFECIGPAKFNIWGYPKKKKLKTCSNTEADKIFEIAEDIYSKL